MIVHNVNLLAHGAGLWGQLLSRFAGFGWIGVQLFFVLSGFLITRNLLASQDSPQALRSFYGRRMLRIFPLYYATLIFFFVLWPLVGSLPKPYADEVPTQIWLWLFLSNWTEWSGMGGLSLPHFWSLAVEEQFYLLWPFVIRHRTPRQILLICIAIALLSVASRAALLWFEFSPLQVYTFTISRMDALALGAAAAACLQTPEAARKLVANRYRLLMAAAVIFMIGRVIPKAYGMTDAIGQILGFSLLSVVFTLFVLAAACGDAAPLNRWQRMLQWAPLRTLGKYSFAMYVFHAPLNTLVGEPLLAHWQWREHLTTGQAYVHVLGIGALSFVLAWLSYHLMEKHFLRLKRYFPV